MDYSVRDVVRDGATVLQMACPGRGKWQDLDDDQYHGRVSIECGFDCGYHATVDVAAALDKP